MIFIKLGGWLTSVFRQQSMFVFASFDSVSKQNYYTLPYHIFPRHICVLFKASAAFWIDTITLYASRIVHFVTVDGEINLLIN